MYAPVATRVRTYGLPVTNLVADWVEAILNHPHMKQWEQEAEREAIEIPKYDQVVEEGRLRYDAG